MDEGSRRSKLNELKKELNELQLQYATILNKVNELKGKLWVVKYQEKKALQCQKKKYSFLERVFTKRKDYHTDQVILRSLDSIKKKQVDLNKLLLDAERRAFEKIKASGIEEKIEKLENEIKKLENEIQDERPQNKRLTTFKVDNFMRGKSVNDQENGTTCGQ